MLSQARKFEWSSALDAALSQTYSYFNTPIPEQVRASLSEQSDRHQQLVALMQIQPATHILEERQKILSLNYYGRFHRSPPCLDPPSTRLYALALSIENFVDVTRILF